MRFDIQIKIGAIMKKLITFFILTFFFSSQSFPQSAWFATLNETNMKSYAQPFANVYGIALNSGGFHSAYISDLWGFSISFQGMYISVPDDQLTFKPSLPAGYTTKSTSTIFGEMKGGAFAGPNGYITTPPGTNIAPVPVVFPQIGASFWGTEVILRYIPDVTIGSIEKVGLLGIGIKHSISRYIPLIPVDVAVQILYNSFNFVYKDESKDVGKIDANNLAFNAHASKSFGIVTPYFGLQYETATMDLEYEIKPNPASGDPDVAAGLKGKVSMDGENNFRAILGASLKLGFLLLNADMGLGSQTVFGGGLSFEF
jgi:hypothetical protein